MLGGDMFIGIFVLKLINVLFQKKNLEAGKLI